MKIIIFFLLSFFVTGTNAQIKRVKNGFKIIGKTSFPITGFVHLKYLNKAAKQIHDSCLVTNSKFSFIGEVNGYYRNTYLWTKKLNKEKNKTETVELKFGLNNRIIKIDFSLNNPNESFINGNETDKEVKKFEGTTAKKLIYQLDTIEKSKNIDNNKQFTHLRKQLKTIIVKQIKKYPNSNTSSFLLFDYKNLFINDELEKCFKLLSIEQQNTYYGKFLHKGIKDRELKHSQIGLSILNFKATTYFGDTISLYNYTKQGYVLLDFWASWCNPCRASHPSLKKLHEKYSKKGLTVIGISCDEVKDEAEWRKAIINDSIWFWSNIMTTASNSKEKYQNLNLLEDYKVSFLPTQILLDSSNKIVARLQNEMELIKKLKEIYGE